MAALTTALVATAAIGAGASIYAGSQQNKAIKQAGQQQNDASNQAIAYQREARDYARQVLSKYSGEGDAARSRMQAFLGLKKPTASGQYSGAMGSAQPRLDYAGYVNGDPGLAAEWSKPGVQKMFGGDVAKYGEWHAQNYAHEGRQIPMTGGGQPGAGDPTAVPAETQEEAWAAYEATPWGKIGVMEADKARDDFTSMAGAQGSALSGRTARGMAEVAEEAKLRNFSGYYGALGGVADTGFMADTGIASGGQQFAQTAANVEMARGNNAANLAMAKGQNNANTMNDLAGWIGWGVGNWQTAPPGGSSFKASGSPSTVNYSGSKNRGARIS